MKRIHIDFSVNLVYELAPPMYRVMNREVAHIPCVLVLNKTGGIGCDSALFTHPFTLSIS